MHPLIQYRQTKKMSQRAFSEAIGIHQSVLSKFESGKATPSLKTALDIQNATAGAVPVDIWIEKEQTDEAAE